MAYTKTVWVDGSAPAISAANLNKIEQGVYDSVRQDGTTAMSAQLVTIAGSATTPAIAPTGDSNTGIFFPAENLIGITIDGSERVRFKSNGFVGVGDLDPSYRLDVVNYAATPLRVQRSGEYGEVIKIGRAGVGDTAGISYPADGTFQITTAATPRITINASGNVGIGTTSPSSVLHIYKSDSTSNPLTLSNTSALTLQNPYGSAANTGSSIFFKSDTGTYNTFAGIAGNMGGSTTSGSYGDLLFATKASDTASSLSERMRITYAGNVGIGTTSPSAKLELSDGTITLQHDLVAGGGYVGTKSNHPLVLFTNNTEKMRILASGSVGIGISPTQKIHVYDANAVIQINEVATGGSGVSAYRLKHGSNYMGWYLDSGNALVTYDYQASAERMRVSSAGYLLVGYTTSNGAYPLQVNGQIFATSSTIATSDQRYKENVTPLTGALSLVNALNPVQFDWKQHPVHNFNTEQPTVGFLAQEVAEVLKDQPYLNSVVKKSECTWETETGEFVDVTKQVEVDGELVDEVTQEAVKETHTEEFYGIAESNLIAILTKAVQELSAKVTALEAQIAKK